VKAAEARRLIGKTVSWGDPSSPWRVKRREVFAEVIGRNVRTVDGDWLWLPSLPDKVEILEPQE
jgi:hypothetical protein